MYKKLGYLILVFLFVFIWSGCSKKQNLTTTPPTTTPTVDKTASVQTANEGFNQFFDGNSSEADKKFDTALNQDPNNTAAVLGKSLTNILTVIDDPQTQELVKRIEQDKVFVDTGGSPLPKSSKDLFEEGKKTANSVVMTSAAIRTFAQMAEEKPLQVSDFQKWIENVLLPRLDNADRYLSKIETYPNFVYVVDLKNVDAQIPENERYLELDLGEVYAAHSVLQLIRGILYIGVSFDFDFDRCKMEQMCNANRNNTTNMIIDYYNPLVDPNYNFMGLRANGRVNMKNAKLCFINSTEKLEASLDFILTETDIQTDDIIKKEEIDVDDVKLIKLVCKDIRDCFNGKTFTVRKGYPEIQNGEICTWDQQGKYPIQINLGNWFDKVPALKVFLPIYDAEGMPCCYDKSGNLVKYYQIKYVDGKKCLEFIEANVDWMTIKFADPTFAGLLPNMTNDIVTELIHQDTTSYAYMTKKSFR